MAVDEVVISVKEPQEVVAEFVKITTLADLKLKILQPENEEISGSGLQCPKVPKGLRSDVEGAEDYYEPKVMSLGPYHRGKHHLVRGETLKLKLAADYMSKKQLTEQEEMQLQGGKIDYFYRKISDILTELRGCYDSEGLSEISSDEEFSVMMLVDGCALLAYILCICLGGDPEDFNIKHEDLSLIHQDALLLENQLPYQLLENLMDENMLADTDFRADVFKEFLGIDDKSLFDKDKESFLRKMKNYCSGLFLAINQIINRNPNPNSDTESERCHHLLDLYRRNFLGDERCSPTHTENGNSGTEIDRGGASVRHVKEQVMASFRNVKELMAAGIRIKPSRTRYLRDISFSSNGITAYLRLPPITIDKSTKTIFLNLIAYEMSLHVPHDFISYLRFLDSLIDHADDVKELQSAGVLQNSLGTHEEVAQFFNTVSANSVSDFHAYTDVRVKIRKHLKSHYNSKMKMWMTQCLDTYFGSPWTIIAWLGAALALFLTAVQTYFSVFPH